MTISAESDGEVSVCGHRRGGQSPSHGWEQSMPCQGAAHQAMGQHQFCSGTRDVPPARQGDRSILAPSSTRHLNRRNAGVSQTRGASFCRVRGSRQPGSLQCLLPCQRTARMGRWMVQPSLTLALKLLGGGGQQQLAFHVRGPSTAGDAWLLVPRLDPAGEPAQVAAAVQGVGPDGSAGGEKAKLHLLPHRGNWARRLWDWMQLHHLAGLPRDGGTQRSSISGPTRGAAHGGRTEAHSPTPLPSSTTLLPAPQPTWRPMALCWGFPPLPAQKSLGVPLQHWNKAAWAQGKLGKAP